MWFYNALVRNNFFYKISDASLLFSQFFWPPINVKWWSSSQRSTTSTTPHFSWQARIHVGNRFSFWKCVFKPFMVFERRYWIIISDLLSQTRNKGDNEKKLELMMYILHVCFMYPVISCMNRLYTSCSHKHQHAVCRDTLYCVWI